MMSHVYVIGNNTGRFQLRGIVDAEGYIAPTLWSWRAYGPQAVSLPSGVLTGQQLSTWVDQLRRSGYALTSVTTSTSGR